MMIKVKGNLTNPNYSLAPILKVRAKSLIKVINCGLADKMDLNNYESIQSVNEVGELLVNIVELLKDATVDSDLDVFVEEIFEVAMNNDIYDLMTQFRTIIVKMSNPPAISYRLLFYAVINLIIRAYDYGTVVGIKQDSKEVVFNTAELNLLDREMIILLEANNRHVLDSELEFFSELRTYMQENESEPLKNFANKLRLIDEEELFKMLFEVPNTLAEVVVDMIMRDIKPHQSITGKFYSSVKLQSYHADVVGYSEEPMNWASKEVMMEVVTASNIKDLAIPKEGIKLLLPPNTDEIFAITINRNVRDGLDILTIDSETLHGVSRFNWFDLDNPSTFYSQTHYSMDSVTATVCLYYLGVVDEELVDIPNQYRKAPVDVQELVNATMQTILNSYKTLSNLAYKHN